MSKKHAKPTTAGNLEAKFEAGEDVLDYFDLNAAKVVTPVKRLVRKPVRGVTAISLRSSLALLKRALETAARIKELESKLRSYVNRLPEEAQNRILHYPKKERRFGWHGANPKVKASIKGDWSGVFPGKLATKSQSKSPLV